MRAAGSMRVAGALRASAQSLTERGRSAAEVGDPAAAEKLYLDALRAYGELEDRYESARVLLSLADLRLSSGNHADAAELARQAAERVPGDVSALTVLGQALWRGGSPADAEVAFGEALRSDPRAVQALAGRGQVRVALGHYREALTDLDQALALGLHGTAAADVHAARAVALADGERDGTGAT
jgi:tetratricopeptide (TPR) repeat protein